MEQVFACARENSRQQRRELLGQSICTAKWQWSGCLPHLGHSSGQTKSLLLLLQPPRWQFCRSSPPRESSWDPCPDCLWLHRSRCSAIPLLPMAAQLHAWLLFFFFVAALQIPQHLCLAPCACMKQLKVQVWNICMSSGVGGLQVHGACWSSYRDAKFEREGYKRKCFKWLN